MCFAVILQSKLLYVCHDKLLVIDLSTDRGSADPLSTDRGVRGEGVRGDVGLLGECRNLQESVQAKCFAIKFFKILFIMASCSHDPSRAQYL